MSSMWKRALVALGLDDEDEFDDVYMSEDPRAQTQRAPEQGPSVRPLASEPGSGAVQTRPTVIRTMPSTAARVHVVEPRGFDQAQEVGDRLKANQPVIISLQGLDRELQRRLIDFASGLTYALGGSMQRVADQVFLLSPTNVEVSQEEKERLRARGLFDH